MVCFFETRATACERCPAQPRIYQMTRLLSPSAKFFAIATLTAILGLAKVSAAPSAEVAKRCLHYSYIAYPFKRPGAMHMSGDRQAYFKDCIAKDGDVPEPTPPKP
jgi:hypothetical protein